MNWLTCTRLAGVTRLSLPVLMAAWLLSGCDGNSPSTSADSSAGSDPSADAAPSSTAAVPASEPAGGVIGLVLTDFTFEQPPLDPAEACPEGFNLNEFELALTDRAPPGLEVDGDMPVDQFLRLMRESGAPDACEDPTVYVDDSFRTMDLQPAVSRGFNLREDTPWQSDSGACPRTTFTGPNGEQLVDNQLWRVLGCIRGYQRGGTIDEYALTNIREGARTILIRIAGVDASGNGDDVEVGIYSSQEPIPTDAAGNLLPGASLQVTDELRYHNVTRGKLVDGLLTVEPVDLQLDFQGQYLDSEYEFRNAQLQIQLQPDGGATGLLGGYWDVEAFYDAYGRQATRSGVYYVGFSCPGMHAALHRLADGHPDPDTGVCTSISTTFRLEAIPAFVILPEQQPPTMASAER